jgi:sirohydrochlorin cobaltochelatase
MNDVCLILLAHGSPDPRWRAPFEKLAEAIGRELDGGRVKLAYMEFAAPSLKKAAGEAHREGFTALRVLPLFMAGGGHVGRDIPVLAEALRGQFPGLSVEILPPIGEHPRVAEAMRETALEALSQKGREDIDAG